MLPLLSSVVRFRPVTPCLVVEASLDLAVPSPAQLFESDASEDPVARLDRVASALHAMIRANEASLRLILMNSLQRAGNGDVPPRQNRRTPLIEAALEPARSQFKPAALKNLVRGLALIIGTEAMVVLKDVLQLDEAEAQKVRRWAIRALVEAARK
jgi:hypothetical protein